MNKRPRSKWPKAIPIKSRMDSRHSSEDGVILHLTPVERQSATRNHSSENLSMNANDNDTTTLTDDDWDDLNEENFE